MFSSWSISNRIPYSYPRIIQRYLTVCYTRQKYLLLWSGSLRFKNLLLANEKISRLPRCHGGKVRAPSRKCRWSSCFMLSQLYTNRENVEFNVFVLILLWNKHASSIYILEFVEPTKAIRRQRKDYEPLQTSSKTHKIFSQSSKTHMMSWHIYYCFRYHGCDFLSQEWLTNKIILYIH